MKRALIYLAAAIGVGCLVLAGCAPAAPAPAPTKAPAAPAPAATQAPAAAPTKAPAAPTTAAAAQPTAAPAKKVAFPTKGNSITIIVPYDAGGSTDAMARMLAPTMEKDLGVPVEVVNVAGGGGQVGITRLATAKPDGYTIGFANLPTVITIYRDPARKAAFTRKSFEPLAVLTINPDVVGVRNESPFKSVKDIQDAAKANPGKVRVVVAGLNTDPHLAALMLQKLMDVKFAIVNESGAAPAMTAMLGGHVDFNTGRVANYAPHLKSGAARILGVMDTRESEFLPGVKTLEALGYGKAYMQGADAIALPAGTPREVVDILNQSVKKAVTSAEFKAKMASMFFESNSMDAAAHAAYWDDLESRVGPLMELAAQK